jgi:hypothetical protein
VLLSRKRIISFQGLSVLTTRALNYPQLKTSLNKTRLAHSSPATAGGEPAPGCPSVGSGALTMYTDNTKFVMEKADSDVTRTLRLKMH